MIDGGDIAASLLDDYERDGAVCLRGAFDVGWIELLHGAVERDIADPGPNATNFAEGSTAGTFFGDMFMWRRDPDFRAAAVASPAAAIAAGLMISAATTTRRRPSLSARAPPIGSKARFASEYAAIASPTRNGVPPSSCARGPMTGRRAKLSMKARKTAT